MGGGGSFVLPEAVLQQTMIIDVYDENCEDSHGYDDEFVKM